MCRLVVVCFVSLVSSGVAQELQSNVVQGESERAAVEPQQPVIRGSGGGTGTIRCCVRSARCPNQELETWLVRHQSPDGSWEQDVRTTSLALLALIGHRRGRPCVDSASSVSQGLAWLASRQDRFGCVGSSTAADGLEQHALATLVLCEALRNGRGEEWRRSAESAASFLLARRGRNGTWSSPGKPVDPMATGWAMLALHSASQESIRAGWRPGVAQFDLVDRGAGDQEPRVAAMSLLVRVVHEDVDEEPSWVRHAEFMRAHPPKLEEPDPVYWLLGYFGMFQAGRGDSDPWSKRLNEVVPARVPAPTENGEGRVETAAIRLMIRSAHVNFSFGS